MECVAVIDRRVYVRAQMSEKQLNDRCRCGSKACTNPTCKDPADLEEEQNDE